MAQPAAVPGSASQSAASAPLSPDELKALADSLENDAERRKLIDSLRALAAAREAGGKPAAAGQAETGQNAAAAESADPGAAIIDGMMMQMRRAGSAFAALGAIFSDLPALADWARLQVENPHRRALWTDVLWKLGATLIVALLLQALAHVLIRRPLAALRPPQVEGEATPHPWLQMILAILRALIGLIPIVVFAAAAYGMLTFIAPNAITRDLAQIVVLAFVAATAVGVVGDFLFNRGGGAMRALHVDEETAAYILLWLRRLSAFAIYGYAIVRIADRLHVPPAAADTIAKLIGFAFAALLAVLVLQARAPVAARIRGTAPPAESRWRTWRVLRQRAGDVWHVLALLYIAAAYAVWAFDVQGGFHIILRGTLLTIVILFLVRLLRFAAAEGFRRLFAIGRETRQRFPGLEARANRYLPLLIGLVRGALYVVAAFAILQAWGIDTLTWVTTETGRGIVARIVTIALVVVTTLVLWELTATAIEYYLTQPGPDGLPTPRSGRVRTLLPLLRRTVSIVLGLIAGLIVLSELGINIAPLLAGAGVIGIAVGFGAQSLVKDIITGVFILTEDTISVGDIVDLGGNAGVVEDISIRTIRLRDADGIFHVIPYSEVTKIKNMTRGYAQAVFEVRVAYREDIDNVIAVLKQLAEEFRAEPEWNARILDPFEMWGVDQLDVSGVVIKARFRTLPAQQWSVRREFSKRIKKRFDELGIEIPFPHHRIYFGSDKQGKAPPVHIVSDAAPAAALDGVDGAGKPEDGAAASGAEPKSQLP
ncbi:MAG TPA: mechanosensitive ion channel domain-containing protein [Ferrovibrio sp.]|uniref:mechanosensitive ion channel domain-containing protein n=1 Tax=Ferrovibrio sp. TaxID=1917215 RepID=UPI002ED01197